MTQDTVVGTLKDALLSIGSDDLGSLKKYFRDEATFFVPGGPYRIESLESYFNCVTIPTREIGLAVINVDIRQAIVTTLGDNSTLISFHYARHVSNAGSVVGASGRGTVILDNEKIIHLHLEDNVARSPIQAAQGMESGRSMLSSAAAKMYAWGSSPEMEA
ncbi:hypothetical protein [Rhodopseudomonas palustris]|uniref:hypothetical protein n=1 Tax=Rhodopseudomonas palustris TaxID=1076 RepID=UPI0011C48948|nr:hypothetical protein [Rhodopseudomonas palustris]